MFISHLLLLLILGVHGCAVVVVDVLLLTILRLESLVILRVTVRLLRRTHAATHAC